VHFIYRFCDKKIIYVVYLMLAIKWLHFCWLCCGQTLAMYSEIKTTKEHCNSYHLIYLAVLSSPFQFQMYHYVYISYTHTCLQCGITTFVSDILVGLLYLDVPFSVAISCFWMGFQLSNYSFVQPYYAPYICSIISNTFILCIPFCAFYFD